MFLLMACSAEDGEDGATGPQGAQGIQGEQGAQGDAGQDGTDGAQGEQGEPGTANVIYSDWFTADFGPTPINEPLASYNQNVPSLSQELKDNGLLMVYTRRDLGPGYVYFTLPYALYDPHYQFYSVKTFAYNNNINISIASIDGGDIYEPYFTEFRYVLIPGGTLASKSGANLSKMSYPDIATLFNLRD